MGRNSPVEWNLLATDDDHLLLLGNQIVHSQRLLCLQTPKKFLMSLFYGEQFQSTHRVIINCTRPSILFRFIINLRRWCLHRIIFIDLRVMGWLMFCYEFKIKANKSCVCLSSYLCTARDYLDDKCSPLWM